MRITLTILALAFFVSCASPPDPIPLSAVDPSYAKRGEYLVKSVAACGFCHGKESVPDSSLSGGRRQVDGYGEAVALNLTPDETGLKGWDLTTITKAIRNSLGKEDEGFSPAFHRGFEWMSDSDALSIAAYLQSLAPVKNNVERRSIGFLSRNTVGIFEASAKEIHGYVPTVQKDNNLKYGEYLVNNVARCERCHNSPGSLLENERYLEGGSIVEVEGEKKSSPGLKAAGGFGLSSWSSKDIVAYLRTGRTPDKREVDTKFCPIPFYRLAATSELEAIAAYLKSLTS